MPVVELHVLEGYNSFTKQRLGEALTDAVRFVVPADPDLITVMIHDVPSQNYYRGRVSRKPAPARQDPENIVRSFLKSMEARALKDARQYLDDGFEMRFPGTDPMQDLQDLVDWAGPRYRFVKKSYDGFDSLQGSGEAAIVYCRGTLSGEWPDGTPFDGIRFVDRFEVKEDRITRQDVWNDIAEMRAKL